MVLLDDHLHAILALPEGDTRYSARFLVPTRGARRYTQVYFGVVLPVWTKRYYPVPPVNNTPVRPSR